MPQVTTTDERYAAEAEGKTVIVNACGHLWSYNIRRPSAIKWLRTRPCPRCAGAARRGRPKSWKSSSPDALPKQPTDDQEAQDAPDESGHQDAKQPTDDQEAPNRSKSKSKPSRRPSRDQIAAQLAEWPSLPSTGMVHPALVRTLLLLDANIPVWLQGPPGTSKSTIAHQAADALGIPLHTVACHELMSRTDLFGFELNGRTTRTPLWDAYEHGGILLLDEIDNGNPNLLAALNGALSNSRCVFASSYAIERHPDFRCIATANTAGIGPEAGYVGRLGVDLATRDRFVTIQVPIDETLECGITAIAAGDSEIAASAETESRKQAAAIFAEHAAAAVQARGQTMRVLSVVQRVRALVDATFRGCVVSPRTPQHVAAMLRRGWCLDDAIAAKLVGLKPAEIEHVLTEVGKS